MAANSWFESEPWRMSSELLLGRGSLMAGRAAFSLNCGLNGEDRRSGLSQRYHTRGLDWRCRGRTLATVWVRSTRTRFFLIRPRRRSRGSWKLSGDPTPVLVGGGFVPPPFTFRPGIGKWRGGLQVCETRVFRPQEPRFRVPDILNLNVLA